MNTAENPSDHTDRLTPRPKAEHFSDIPETGYGLAPTERLALPMREVAWPAEDETLQFPDWTVNGNVVATLRMGSEETHSDVFIVDVRKQAVAGELPEGTGNFLLVMPSANGTTTKIRALTPGQEWKLGSEQQDFGKTDHFADTVARLHCAVEITESGELVVTNNNPTNKTELFVGSPELAKPEVASEIEKQTLSDSQAIELLSYSDVLADDPSAFQEAQKSVMTSESGQKYARELVSISQEIGAEELMKFATQAHDVYKQDMEQLGLTSSKWGESISWTLWDIAKQRYLATHPEESSDEYNGEGNVRPGDPLNSENVHAHLKLNEIIDRHIGWEYMLAHGQGTVDTVDLHWIARGEAEKILGSGERNTTGQLRSFELTELGTKLRSVFHEGYDTLTRKGRLPKPPAK